MQPLKCECGVCKVCRARDRRQQRAARVAHRREYQRLWWEKRHAENVPAELRQVHYDLVRAIELQIYGPQPPVSSLDPRRLFRLLPDGDVA
jgi:hypothetical protein